MCKTFRCGVLVPSQSNAPKPGKVTSQLLRYAATSHLCSGGFCMKMTCLALPYLDDGVIVVSSCYFATRLPPPPPSPLRMTSMLCPAEAYAVSPSLRIVALFSLSACWRRSTAAAPNAPLLVSLFLLWFISLFVWPGALFCFCSNALSVPLPPSLPLPLRFQFNVKVLSSEYAKYYFHLRYVSFRFFRFEFVIISLFHYFTCS